MYLLIPHIETFSMAYNINSTALVFFNQYSNSLPRYKYDRFLETTSVWIKSYVALVERRLLSYPHLIMFVMQNINSRDVQTKNVVNNVDMSCLRAP